MLTAPPGVTFTVINAATGQSSQIPLPRRYWGEFSEKGEVSQIADQLAGIFPNGYEIQDQTAKYPNVVCPEDNTVRSWWIVGTAQKDGGNYLVEDCLGSVVDRMTNPDFVEDHNDGGVIGGPVLNLRVDAPPTDDLPGVGSLHWGPIKA